MERTALIFLTLAIVGHIGAVPLERDIYLQPVSRAARLALPIVGDDSLPTLPYSSLEQLLKCFSLDNVITTIQSYMTAGLLTGGTLTSAQITSYFDIIHEGVATALEEGLVGHGQYLCGQYTANATLGSTSCLLNGEQSFLSDELANGYQTILCGELSENYVQFLDGYIKMYMTNSVDTPFNGYIDFGPILGRMTGVISTSGITAKFGGIGGIEMKF